MSQSSIQNFLRNSGVTVVRGNNNTPRRMDPFSTPPSSPRVRKAPLTLSTPSPLAKRRAMSLSPPRVPLVRANASTPLPQRSLARRQLGVIRAVPTRAKLTFEPLRVMMATAVTESKRKGGPGVSVARLMAKKPKQRKEPLVVAGKHYEIRVLRINGRDRMNRVTTSTKDVKAVEYNVEVTTRGGQTTKGSLYVYESGNVRYSGGVAGGDFATVHAIQRYVVYTYTPRQRFLYHPLKFSNVTGQFRGNFVLNATAFARFLSSRKIPFTYEPELQQYFFRVEQGKQSFMVRNTGLVQLFKAENPTQLRRIYNKAKDLLMIANMHGMLAAPTGLTPKFHSPAPVKKRALPSVSTPTVTWSMNGSVCINGKSCDKFKKSELLAYANKLNVHLPKHVLKPDIIKRIATKSRPVTNALQSIREELWNTRYDQRLLKNNTKRKIFKARLDADARKIQAIINKLPKRHRNSVGEVKKTIRNIVLNEVASDTKAYVELSLEIEKYLKEPMSP